MYEIAIYGKGGIGKSTVSANLSAALANNNLRVLQIGCDPKHDSTRLLMNGYQVTTVLDYIRITGPADYKINDVLFHGYKNIGCVEAGGPEPGVGCAGRGIITTFELLDQFRIKDNYDITVYDVLGDVVCGGFAVPIRKEYADAIFIVTSGEYMALYAANNILRGIKNYDGNDHRVAGIIYNKRNIEGEDERIKSFSETVDLPVCGTIPRSDVFAQADKDNKTVVESGLDYQLDNVFSNLATKINSEMKLYEAKPVSDIELEQMVFGETKTIVEPSKVEEVAKKKTESRPNIDLSNVNQYLSKNMTYNEPLHGCAFNGAISMAVHLQDVAIIAHSPKSCTYLSYQSISSSGRRGLFERGALLPVSIAPNFESTNMDEADIIFGGMDTLEQKIEEVKQRNPKAIVVISSCPSGIIGDDIDKVKNNSNEGIPIYTIKADGNLAGDYLQGMLMTYTSLAKGFIKKDVATIPNTVNIVFEKVVAKNTNSNFKIIEDYLNFMNITVNCRFLCETTLDKLENFVSAPLNLLAFKDYTGEILKDFFVKEYNSTFLEQQFPVGFDETKQWLYEVSNFFNCNDKVAPLIEQHELNYLEQVKLLRPQLVGKRLMIITYNHQLDWVLKTALDLGIEIVKIGILNFSQDTGFRTNYDNDFNVEENYDADKRQQDIEYYNPDILLTNYAPADKSKVKIIDTIPMCPDVGFYSGLIMAQRWSTLLKLNVQGEWENDEQLFKKHYSR